MLLWLQGIFCRCGHSSPVIFQKTLRGFDYRDAATREVGARARQAGISASNFILPWLQQGQVVMSVPVSCRIICSSEACDLAGCVGNFNNLRMSFKFALRLRLAKNP